MLDALPSSFIVAGIRMRWVGKRYMPIVKVPGKFLGQRCPLNADI